jgi:hypothetical protein
MILNDEPTNIETLAEYALRFDAGEGFLDQKSNCFQWENSRLRNRHALHRLCFVMAVAALILVCQGSTVVVAEGKRGIVSILIGSADTATPALARTGFAGYWPW